MSRAISKYMIANATALPIANATVGQMAIRQAAEGPCDLCFLENITNTTNGVYQRTLTLRVHFVAQAINLHVHDVRGRIDSHTPHPIENHGASDHASGIANQIFQ